PLSEVEKLTVSDNPKDKNAKQRTYYNIQPYLHGTKSGVGIYVDDSHVTHGILFKGVDVFDQQTDGISIFKNGIHQNLDPDSPLEQTEKEKLSPLFEKVLGELDLAQDSETTQFEAGKLDRLSLHRIQQRRLTGVVVKHRNEWKKGRSEDFRAVCEVFEKYGQQAESDWVKQRASNLEIGLEVGQFSTSKEAYYFHPLGLIQALTPYSACFCHRDFTVEEVKNIVNTLSGVNSGNYSLFNARNCLLKEEDRTYARLTEELNKACQRYDINTCIRKVHFLAQVYLETASLKTTEELASGKDYEPGKGAAIKNHNTIIGDGSRYKGRGAMQLTWRINYIKYFEHTRTDSAYYVPTIPKETKIEDMKDRNNRFHYLISEKLFLSFDSAGWYWKYGSAWRDLNKYADNDDVYTVNVGINGGANGFKERMLWLKKLIKANNIENCSNLSLTKELGIYKLSTSHMRNTKVGSRLKLGKYDD
ncbi:glycoside hydrolase family 19 protein, partial [Actinobacillus vicugnae]|uniref:glycoside hydrolase family 19 protein n=1 Tax=Actinobacillus vicugnae TaxID=2573093 RepID=UPI003CC7FD1B